MNHIGGTLRGMKRTFARTLCAALLGAAAIFTGTPAWATTTENGSAGGIRDTFTLVDVLPRQPYAPNPADYFGDYRCGLRYHEYLATPGCGGFEITMVLHDVTKRPGWADNADDSGHIQATADTARTFGCRNANGSFDWASAFVVRETARPLQPFYILTDLGYLWSVLRVSGEPDATTRFYVNFRPVDFTCPAGKTKAQYGLKVSNVTVWTQNSKVLGSTTWRHAGPYYG
jgi:hypothetical protein